MKNLITLILTAVSVTACAVDDGYYTEQRTYGNSYGGASWYRDEVPYYPNYPNYDRNRNGIPDRKEQERDRDGKSNRTDSNRNWNTGPNRQNQSDDKFRDGDKAPNYKGDRSGNYYGR